MKLPWSTRNKPTEIADQQKKQDKLTYRLWSLALFNITSLLVLFAAFLFHQDNPEQTLAQPQQVTTEVSKQPIQRAPQHFPTRFHIKRDKHATHSKPSVKVKTQQTNQQPASVTGTKDSPAPDAAQVTPAQSEKTRLPEKKETPGSSQLEPQPPIPSSPVVPKQVENKQPPELPPYEILHSAWISPTRKYAEILVPSLSTQSPKKEIKRVAKALVKKENLYRLVLYCTREARKAHYSMDYSDTHPQALSQGLLCYIDRGWFRLAGPKDWGIVKK